MRKSMLLVWKKMFFDQLIKIIIEPSVKTKKKSETITITSDQYDEVHKTAKKIKLHS